MKKIGRMNSYTPDSPPTGGTAKKIWEALHSFGFEVGELHYNPNCFGHGDGWGTWAFSETGDENSPDGYFCGYDAEGGVYVCALAPTLNGWHRIIISTPDNLTISRMTDDNLLYQPREIHN